MRKSSVFAFLAAFLLWFSAELKASAPTPPSQAAGYSLVFYDDLVNLNLSSDGTGKYTWYPGIWWQSPPAPFGASINSAGLRLAWNQGQNPPNTTVNSCSSNGTRCQAFRYGYFEAKMKWDVATGAWPAFWMTPVESIWGANETGELDVFEGQGDPTNSHTFFGTIHDWVSTNGTWIDVANNNGHNFHTMPGVDFSQWHTYGVLWAPGTVTWYFDNEPVLSASTYPIFDQQEYFLMLAAQEGAYWSTGNMSGVTASSLNVDVKWVKVWQNRAPQKPIL